MRPIDHIAPVIGAFAVLAYARLRAWWDQRFLISLKPKEPKQMGDKIERVAYAIKDALNASGPFDIHSPDEGTLNSLEWDEWDAVLRAAQAAVEAATDAPEQGEQGVYL